MRMVLAPLRKAIKQAYTVQEIQAPTGYVLS